MPANGFDTLAFAHWPIKYLSQFRVRTSGHGDGPKMWTNSTLNNARKCHSRGNTFGRLQNSFNSKSTNLFQILINLSQRGHWKDELTELEVIAERSLISGHQAMQDNLVGQIGFDPNVHRYH